mmetsp:Transcript_22850/g.44583  ORF Transcript_22850/g.44583 Transcript_22850/m.44583 type:complete len:173 (+) Transcript_22850:112-630(+)
MVLTKRQLAFSKKVLEDKHFAMAAKYFDRGDDVAINTYHRNIQELLVKKGFRANREDYKSYHWNCEHGAHNSIGLWYDYLPCNGYMEDPKKNIDTPIKKNKIKKKKKKKSSKNRSEAKEAKKNTVVDNACNKNAGNDITDGARSSEQASRLQMAWNQVARGSSAGGLLAVGA